MVFLLFLFIFFNCLVFAQNSQKIGLCALQQAFNYPDLPGMIKRFESTMINLNFSRFSAFVTFCRYEKAFDSDSSLFYEFFELTMLLTSLFFFLVYIVIDFNYHLLIFSLGWRNNDCATNGASWTDVIIKYANTFKNELL